jgi:hypothetical protein
MKENELEWSQFIRLGDMIADGLHYEEPWISKEYKRLSRILIPEIKEQEAENRRQKNKNIDKQLEEKLKTDCCSKCNSKLKQTRSGSKVVQCINEECKAKFRYKSKKK